MRHKHIQDDAQVVYFRFFSVKGRIATAVMLPLHCSAILHHYLQVPDSTQSGENWDKLNSTTAEPLLPSAWGCCCAKVTQAQGCMGQNQRTAVENAEIRERSTKPQRSYATSGAEKS